MKKRLLACILSLVMIVSLLPTAALAVDETQDGETPIVCTKDENCEAKIHDEGCPLYVAPEENEDSTEDELTVPANNVVEPTAEEQLAELIAALPDPADIDPEDKEQVEEVNSQISEIYAFAGENNLDVEDNEIINTVIAALYPAEPLAAPAVNKISGNCGPYDYEKHGYTDTVKWTLTENDSNNYTLTIFGDGPMGDAYTTKNDVSSGAPEWHSSYEKITQVVIHNGVISVGAKSFRNYTNLKTVVLPPSITKIGQDSFYGSGIAAITLPENLTTIETQAFYKCSSLCGTISVPVGVVSIPNYTFAGTSISSIEFKGDVTEIGVNAFMGCSSLTSITLPNTVTSIASGAFSGCTQLESCVFPENTQLTRISKGTFKGCTKLEEVLIPDSVTEIAESAFQGCTALKRVVLSNKLNTIGSMAFKDASSMKGVYIPASVSQIPENNNQIFKGMANNSVIYLGSSDLVSLMLRSSANPASTSNGFDSSKTSLAITNGGTFAANTEFTTGTLATPIKDRSIFESWYTKDGTNNDWGEKVTTPTANNTYYAKWTASSYSVDHSVSFDALTYGDAPISKTITVTAPGVDSPSVTSVTNSDSFTASVSGMNVTITPKENLPVGTYSETIIVTTGDGATHNVAVTLTVTKAGSTITPGEDSSAITATYGDTIILTAQTQRAETGIALMTALDEVDFFCGTTPLGSAEVTYENGVGTATLTYDTSKGSIPVGSRQTITAEYGGSVNLNGSYTNSISVTLSPKALTVTGLTATDRTYDGSPSVALTGGTLTGIIGEDDVSATMPTTGTMADANAGDNKSVTVPSIILTGEAANKYTLTQPNDVTVNISKATYDMSSVTFANVSYPYDGNEHTLTISGALPEGVSVTYTNNTRTEVGSTTATASFTGDSTNYETIASMTATLTITEATSTVTITPSATALTGGGTVKLTVSGVPTGGAVTVTQTDNQGSAAKTLDLTSNGEISVSLSNTTAIYTFTVAYDGDSNHAAASASCTVSMTRRSSSGGSDSGSSSSRSAVSVDSAKNGSVTVSPKSAKKGDTVTITVKPDKGYELDELTVTDKNGNEVKVTRKSDTRYTFTMPASRVTVEASFVEIENTPDEGLPFVDVAESAYYYDAVAWAVAEGITSGTSATTFSPDASCTRAQMVTFLWRAAGSPKATGSNPFSDVTSGSYYYDAVLWAVENGITSGTSATTFGPDATVTRGQTVTFLYRAAGSPAASGSSFADVSADAYYADAVAWAVAEGITSGTGNNAFSPDADCTRGQIVTFMYRNMA